MGHRHGGLHTCSMHIIRSSRVEKSAASCSLNRFLGLSEVYLYCGCCWGQLIRADVDSLTSMAAMLLLSAQRLLRSAPPMCFAASGRAAAASECSCSYTVLDAYRCAARHALAHWPILFTAGVALQLSVCREQALVRPGQQQGQRRACAVAWC